MTVTGVSIDSPQFLITSAPNLPFTLASGSSAAISIAFLPDSARAYTGRLTLTAAGFAEELVSLQGTGVAASNSFSISTRKLPDATVDSDYFANIYIEQATLPVLWSLAPGDNLPAGLSLEPTTGRVSGVPILTGKFTFTVQAEDSSNPVQSASSLIALTIEHQTGANCDGITTSLIPIGMLGEEFYQGVQGGHYPGGSNTRPAPHSAGGAAMTSLIKPLDISGRPDPGGVLVLLSIGMSNASREFSDFKQIADIDPEKRTNLVIVDGAQVQQPASVIADTSAQYWTNIDTRLIDAGVTPEQVQIAWIKQANATPSGTLEQYAGSLRDDLSAIVRILKSRYPNIQAAYLSNRTYAGYATSTLNPEPYAYQSAFAVKWLIEQQIDGIGNLNYNEAKGSAVAPWLDWGPNLWTNGLEARTGDHLVWTCQDVEGGDGTHPSSAGSFKAANLLLNFFKNDALTRQWFLAHP